MTYFYVCPDCGPSERQSPIADRDNQVCECGQPLKRDLAAQFKSSQTRIVPWWNEHLTTDVIPKEVKGSGFASKEFRKYASETRGKERWL